MEIKNIIEGWKNLLGFKVMPEEQKAIVEQRAAICAGCEFRHEHLDLCLVCLCYIPAKIRTVEDTCPKGKWNV